MGSALPRSVRSRSHSPSSTSPRALKQFTAIGQWDGASHTNFIPGATMIAFTIITLVLTRRSFATYGLRSQRWRYQLNLGLACSLVMLAVGAGGLLVTGLRLDFTNLQQVLIKNDTGIMDLLRAVRVLNLPQWCIAAGVIRNNVWDYLHGYGDRTLPLDIDVTFYDLERMDDTYEADTERQLADIMLGVQWANSFL